MNLEYLCVSFSDLSECFFVNFGKLFCGKLLCRFYSLLFLFGIFNVYACYCRIALLNTDIFPIATAPYTPLPRYFFIIAPPFYRITVLPHRLTVR